MRTKSALFLGLVLSALVVALIARAAEGPADKADAAPTPTGHHADQMRHMAGMMEHMGAMMDGMGGMMRGLAGEPSKGAGQADKPKCACADMMGGKLDMAKKAGNVGEPGASTGKPPEDSADPSASHAQHPNP
jgi:hypothetical protein